MFKEISWSSYGIFIKIMLVVYYATVGVRYYKREIKLLLFVKQKKSGAYKVIYDNSTVVGAKTIGKARSLFLVKS
jgi:hypothetical protein